LPASDASFTIATSITLKPASMGSSLILEGNGGVPHSTVNVPSRSYAILTLRSESVYLRPITWSMFRTNGIQYECGSQWRCNDR
jgi:hypothetical protein